MIVGITAFTLENYSNLKKNSYLTMAVLIITTEAEEM